MNKIAALVVREKLSFLLLCKRHHTYISFRDVFYSSSNAFHQRYKLQFQQNSLLQSSLSFQRSIAIFTRIKDKVLRAMSNTKKAKGSGRLIYEKIAGDVNYNEFLAYFELPDTFHSWFLSVQLHVWMTILITISEPQGRIFKVSVVDSMWDDVETRLNYLKKMERSSKKEYLNEIDSQFQTAFKSYDEGILSDDTVLAAAAWRTLFSCKHVDPHLLESIVHYIRKQISYLDSQNSQGIIFHSSISFLPLNSIFSEK